MFLHFENISLNNRNVKPLTTPSVTYSAIYTGNSIRGLTDNSSILASITLFHSARVDRKSYTAIVRVEYGGIVMDNRLNGKASGKDKNPIRAIESALINVGLKPSNASLYNCAPNGNEADISILMPGALHGICQQVCNLERKQYLVISNSNDSILKKLYL